MENKKVENIGSFFDEGAGIQETEKKPSRKFNFSQRQQKIKLNPQEVRRQREAAARRQGNNTIVASKTNFINHLSLITGGMFTLGSLCGVGAVGWKMLLKKKVNHPRLGWKIFLSRTITQSSNRILFYGTNLAGVGLLYLMIYKVMNYAFLEELNLLPSFLQPSIFGFLTGAFCKSINGLRPALFTGVIGAAVAPFAVAGFTKLIKKTRI